jgi:hypothetical protein
MLQPKASIFVLRGGAPKHSRRTMLNKNGNWLRNLVVFGLQ